MADSIGGSEVAGKRMTIKRVDAADGAALDELHRLLRDYAHHVRGTAGVEHICLTAYEDELRQLPEVYCAMLVAHSEKEAGGCVLLKAITTIAGEAACEMKRLWVAPAFRSTGAGRALALRLMDEARALGFVAMCLDTIPAEMPAAVGLYGKLGFTPVARYNKNDAAGVKYFRVPL